ncbi:hypothetical protein SSIG_04690 [Streptomyces filamentosus NRRL 11379]|nr:hypothetical protein SSIG_04690 [Streptomyces filamentosus NRRL 11379]
MGRTRPAWKVLTIVAVLVVMAAGLLHTWRNTNVLTEDRLCGGLVSTEQANAVLPGVGRLDAEGDGLDKDFTDTLCRVEKSSVVLGSGQAELTVRVWAKQGDEVLDTAADLSKTSFFPGAVTGGIDTYMGWALLPEKCWTAKQPVVVRVSVGEVTADRKAFAALMADTARVVAAEAKCGDLSGKPGKLIQPRSESARPATEGHVCGLDGLTMRGQVPTGTEVLEAGQKAPADVWTCELTLDDTTSGYVRADGFMKYTAFRDPLLLAAVRKAPGTINGTAPDGREAEIVDKGPGFILPCAEGGPLYLAVESGQQYLEASKRHSDLPRRDAYVEPFVKAAAKTFGCAAPATG